MPLGDALPLPGENTSATRNWRFAIWLYGINRMMVGSVVASYKSSDAKKFLYLMASLMMLYPLFSITYSVMSKNVLIYLPLIPTFLVGIGTFRVAIKWGK